MPDITMCVSKECPKRKRCLRQTATPKEHRQSLSDFYYTHGNACPFFMTLEEKKEVKKK